MFYKIFIYTTPFWNISIPLFIFFCRVTSDHILDNSVFCYMSDFKLFCYFVDCCKVIPFLFIVLLFYFQSHILMSLWRKSRIVNVAHLTKESHLTMRAEYVEIQHLQLIVGAPLAPYTIDYVLISLHRRGLIVIYCKCYS